MHRMLPDGFALIADRHPKRIDARSFEREGRTVEGKERIGEKMQPLCDDVVVPLRMIAELPGDIPHAAHLAGKIATEDQAAVLERKPLVEEGKLKGDGFGLKARKPSLRSGISVLPGKIFCSEWVMTNPIF